MDFDDLIPSKIHLNNRVPEDSDSVLTDQPIWRWVYAGKKYMIDWNSFTLPPDLISWLKLFIVYRFKKRSIATVSKGDIWFLKSLNKFDISFPFLTEELYLLFSSTKESSIIFTFRKFYEFCLGYSAKEFSKQQLLKIQEYKVNSRQPYKSVFLRQEHVTENEIKLVKEHIEINEAKTDYFKLRNNVLLHLCYELAPRISQLHLIDVEDFKCYGKESFSSTKFYSIKLPMVKKRTSNSVEKRNRSISKKLGEKIQILLSLKPESLFSESSPLFIAENGIRLKPSNISALITKELQQFGIKRTPTDFRHFLAQSLADQGASAEVIAEILGHNSTVPARAYITATPKIAEIKSEALGKNKRYQEIMEMMNTGKIVDKSTIPKERWVKGIVGNQYIGGIGGCGLPSNTACPKNPVYACYTCIKFHPFVDGRHSEVKESLQKQVQYHIDIAEAGNDIEHNRPLLQLKRTISAVDEVMGKIKSKDETKPTT